jgi:Flp pilus assembly pilin Flp
MWTVLKRWSADRRGQDLVEYVLLGASLAFAGFLVMSTMDDVINAVYTSWDAATQAIWEPEDPQ